MSLVISAAEKLRIYHERRSLATRVNEHFVASWFSLHELSKMLRVDREQADMKLRELRQGYFIKQSKRDGHTLIFKIVLDDSVRREMLDEALIRKTETYKNECEFINDMLDIIRPNDKSA